MPKTLDDRTLHAMDAYWRAANYLTVGQIYLRDNPLLRDQLRAEHIKPRLLGHWGTSPGQNFVYVHLNRLICEHDADVIFISGPGHGGPSLISHTWLEGSYSEVYPDVSQDMYGMLKMFRQFSSPGGVPSHAGPHLPGSIHEGGELGYSLVHAFGAAFDNPHLIVACVIGDGEAETGPLEGGWKGIKFLHPGRDGAVLPILHLNGYKISGPTVLGRAADEDIRRLLEGHGYEPHFLEGDEPMLMHREFAAILDRCYEAIRSTQDEARRDGLHRTPRWPAIVLRTPKGWTGPNVVDQVKIEGTFRAHQVPLSAVRENPDHLRILQQWMRSYKPEELFDRQGRPVEELRALAPKGLKRMGANPHANGGQITISLDIPSFADYAVPVEMPGTAYVESTRPMGKMLRDIFTRNARQANFRLFCPDETNSNRLGDVFDVENRCLVSEILPDDDHVAANGRVMEVLSEHSHQGWLEAYTLTGRHGLFATYEAFAMIVDSMVTQHAKWLKTCVTELPWRKPVPSLNYLLTSTCWRNDHNGFSHQGPGFIDTLVTKQGIISRIYLPPDANCLLSVADHCLRTRNYINLIVIDKQLHPVWLDIDAAREHCSLGATIWPWAGTENGKEPDVILCAAGDVATEETIAAAWIFRRQFPELSVRVVNVVDLMRLWPPDKHPHGMTDAYFRELFTENKDVIFAFHGYPGAIHQILHGRPNPGRFHVRGYAEEGTTTTPFDMLVLNRASRYHLCIEAMRRLPKQQDKAHALIDSCNEQIDIHRKYVVEHQEDMPDVRNWRWTPD